jgi:hypothetical protein
VEQKQNDDDQQNQADSTAAVVANARPHTVTAKPENQQQNDKDNQQHVFSFLIRLLAFVSFVGCWLHTICGGVLQK